MNSLFSITIQDEILSFLQKKFQSDLNILRPLWINHQQLGYVNQYYLDLILTDIPQYVSMQNQQLHIHTDSWLQAEDLLQNIAWEWYQRGIYDGWRNEKFQVRNQAGENLFTLERSAFRPFGFLSHAVHINGYIIKNDRLYFWIATRSHYKAVDPDKLDNLVGGGVIAGESIFEAMLREGFEEAGIPKNLLTTPTTSSHCLSQRTVKRGLHRELLHIFNFILPDDFIPENQDGEVASFQLMTANEIVEAIINGYFMNDAVLALLTLFSHLNYFDASHPLSLWLKENKQLGSNLISNQS